MALVQLVAPPTQAQAAVQGSGGDNHVPSGFWQRRFVQNVLPFVTSLSLHCGILIVGLLTFKAIQAIGQQPERIQVAPSVTDLIDTKNPDMAAMSNAQLHQVLQDVSKQDTHAAGLNDFNTSAKPELSGGGEQSDAAIFAPGANSSFAVGQGPGRGPGNSDDGSRGPWGAATPKIKVPSIIFGHTPARRIAFVCDASGSMINKMASLKFELGKAVQGLKPIQNFTVVFFNDKPKADALDSTLVPATPLNKRRAAAFLEGVTAASSTNPIPGIEAAFRQQPQLIILLTDGDFPDNEAVLARIRELNKTKAVKVNTIAFVGAGDTDTAFIDLLKTIARENGGSYRHVSEEELGN